jgi:hypothetical protein
MSEDLKAAEREWLGVIERRDVEAAEEFLASDFALSSIGGVGDQVSREAWLANLDKIESSSTFSRAASSVRSGLSARACAGRRRWVSGTSPATMR